MGIELNDSAAEHGYTKQDAIRAIETPLAFVMAFPPTRPGHARPPAAWVGPAR